jgi:hypothetical protein
MNPTTMAAPRRLRVLAPDRLRCHAPICAATPAIADDMLFVRLRARVSVTQKDRDTKGAQDSSTVRFVLECIAWSAVRARWKSGSLVQTICPQPHLAYYWSRHDGADSPRPCAINGNNGGQPYGVHQGRRPLFADGSVRVLRDMIDIRTPVRLATRAGGEW